MYKCVFFYWLLWTVLQRNDEWRRRRQKRRGRGEWSSGTKWSKCSRNMGRMDLKRWVDDAESKPITARFPFTMSGGSGMLWDALRCSEMLWDALGCFKRCWNALGCSKQDSGLLWDAMGCSEMLQEVLECAGMFWDALGCSGDTKFLREFGILWMLAIVGRMSCLGHWIRERREISQKKMMHRIT